MVASRRCQARARLARGAGWRPGRQQQAALPGGLASARADAISLVGSTIMMIRRGCEATALEKYGFGANCLAVYQSCFSCGRAVLTPPRLRLDRPTGHRGTVDACGRSTDVRIIRVGGGAWDPPPSGSAGRPGARRTNKDVAPTVGGSASRRMPRALHPPAKWPAVSMASWRPTRDAPRVPMGPRPRRPRPWPPRGRGGAPRGTSASVRVGAGEAGRQCQWTVNWDPAVWSALRCAHSTPSPDPVHRLAYRTMGHVTMARSVATAAPVHASSPWQRRTMVVHRAVVGVGSTRHAADPSCSGAMGGGAPRSSPHTGRYFLTPRSVGTQAKGGRSIGLAWCSGQAPPARHTKRRPMAPIFLAQDAHDKTAHVAPLFGRWRARAACLRTGGGGQPTPCSRPDPQGAPAPRRWAAHLLASCCLYLYFFLYSCRAAPCSGAVSWWPWGHQLGLHTEMYEQSRYWRLFPLGCPPSVSRARISVASARISVSRGRISVSRGRIAVAFENPST